MGIVIVTDSVGDVPQDLAKKNNIIVVPLTVNFEDGSYLDGVEIDSETFFEKMAKAPKLPTTSQVTIGVFFETFKEIIQNGQQCLGIFMSSKLSGTYSAAITAKGMLKSQDIVVIDSKQVTFAQGQIAIILANLAKHGMDLSTLEKKAYDIIAASQTRYIVDSLEHLRKGGRLKPAEALVGTLLNIKPILTIKEGELKAVSKVRGRKKALQYVIDWLNEGAYDLNDKYVALYHSVEEDFMQLLKNEIEKRYPRAIFHKSQVGAVVGTHSGPGCIAISFIDIKKSVIFDIIL